MSGFKLGKQGLAEEVDFSEADYLLFDMLDKVQINGFFMYRTGMGATPTLGVFYPALNLTALYIHRDIDLSSMLDTSAMRISRIQVDWSLLPYGPQRSGQTLSYMFRAVKRHTPEQSYGTTGFEVMKKWYHREIDIPYTKVSSMHIRHVTVDDMKDIGWDEITSKAWWLLPTLGSLLDKGLHESMAVGFILWALVIPPELREWLSYSEVWRYTFSDVYEFAQTLKTQFTAKAKALQNLVPLDLTPLFEVEVLLNRGLGEISWNEEEEHRTRPQVVTIDKDRVFARATELFGRAKRSYARPSKLQFPTFWKQRWKWGPAGAYYSQYTDDYKWLPEDDMLCHKTYALCNMPTTDISHFLGRKPEMAAKASVKYEWGKQRAIYSTDITNFVMSAYGFAGCEEVLSRVLPIGRAAGATYVQSTVKELLRNGTPYCFDYADFNSQHSIDSMQAVIDAYLEVFTRELTTEQHQAILWVRKSLERMTIEVRGRGSYHANATLLSGWRLTTFINTVLNYVYTSELTEEAKFPFTVSGDDVIGAVTSISQVQRMEAKAHFYNVRFQHSKCYLNSICEFLRVDHRNESGAQYLPRSLATFVHGPTESPIPNDVGAILNAIATRYEECVSRGADRHIMDIVTRSAVKYTCTTWDIPWETYYIYKDTHKSRGGMCDHISDESLRHKMYRVKVREEDGRYITSGIGDEDELPILRGCYEYAEYVVTKYRLHNYKSKILHAINNSVYSKSMRYKYYTGWIKTEVDIVDLLRAKQYGMFRHLFTGTKVLLAKTYNIPVQFVDGYDTYYSDMISHCTDPLAAAANWC